MSDRGRTLHTPGRLGPARSRSRRALLVRTTAKRARAATALVCFVLGLLGAPGLAEATPRVVGYYPAWGIYARNFEIADLPGNKLTHINYAFANLSGDEGLRSRRCGPHNHPNKTPDDVVEKFPFRIRPIRTDRGHEFQALIHWHVADLGMEHVYIKPRTPQLNGKVERSHRTDKDEFYQLLTYRDDVDLEKKLATWENFYNFDRPHGAHGGKTPYEALREKLS